MKKDLIVIALDAAKEYAESTKVNSIDEALEVAKSVFDTLSNAKKSSDDKVMNNFLDD